MIEYLHSSDRNELGRIFKDIHNLNTSVRIEYKPVKSKRSINQNDYYWGVVIPTIANYIGDFNKDTHETLLDIFAPKKEHANKITGEITFKNIRSSEMTTAEFTEYLEKIFIFTETELNLNIPRPSEYGRNQQDGGATPKVTKDFRE